MARVLCAAGYTAERFSDAAMAAGLSNAKTPWIEIERITVGGDSFATIVWMRPYVHSPAEQSAVHHSVLDANGQPLCPRVRRQPDCRFLKHDPQNEIWRISTVLQKTRPKKREAPQLRHVFHA
jgi:hypothetical protein